MKSVELVGTELGARRGVVVGRFRVSRVIAGRRWWSYRERTFTPPDSYRLMEAFQRRMFGAAS